MGERADGKITELTNLKEKATVRKQKLSNEVAGLQGDLAELAQAQAEMTQLRSKQKKAYAVNKADLELGITGVKSALQILREFYSSTDGETQSESSKGVIGLLEVCLSDFEQAAAEAATEESSSAREYKEQTNDN